MVGDFGAVSLPNQDSLAVGRILKLARDLVGENVSSRGDVMGLCLDIYAQ
jgi:hypothetical protein